MLWTAADWAWIGGLVDVVLPALQFGHRLIASQHRFEPEWALEFMQRHGVTHILLTPTALNRLAQIPRPRQRFPDLRLRVAFTGGEPLPGETLRWLESELGVVCNEGYGMSEVNHMIGNCRRLRPIRPGSMGWEFPGHVAALVDETGQAVPDGEPGEIVTRADAPTLFLGYWRQPELTAAMRLGPWVRTRDLAVRDADGYYWYRGRNDDLIKSAGYRIGPVEIEDELMRHPAVAEVAVIGVPDAERGQRVQACVVLGAGSRCFRRAGRSPARAGQAGTRALQGAPLRGVHDRAAAHHHRQGFAGATATGDLSASTALARRTGDVPGLHQRSAGRGGQDRTGGDRAPLPTATAPESESAQPPALKYIMIC